jgi:hypothetical protein
MVGEQILNKDGTVGQLYGWPDGIGCMDDPTNPTKQMCIIYNSEDYGGYNMDSLFLGSNDAKPLILENGSRIGGSRIVKITIDKAKLKYAIMNKTPKDYVIGIDDSFIKTIYNRMGRVVNMSTVDLYINAPNKLTVNQVLTSWPNSVRWYTGATETTGLSKRDKYSWSLNTKYVTSTANVQLLPILNGVSYDYPAYVHSLCHSELYLPNRLVNCAISEPIYFTGEEWNTQGTTASFNDTEGPLLGMTTLCCDIKTGIAYNAPFFPASGGFEKLIVCKSASVNETTIFTQPYPSTTSTQFRPQFLFVGTKNTTKTGSFEFLYKQGLGAGTLYVLCATGSTIPTPTSTPNNYVTVGNINTNIQTNTYKWEPVFDIDADTQATALVAAITGASGNAARIVDNSNVKFWPKYDGVSTLLKDLYEPTSTTQFRNLTGTQIYPAFGSGLSGGRLATEHSFLLTDSAAGTKNIILQQFTTFGAILGIEFDSVNLNVVTLKWIVAPSNYAIGSNPSLSGVTTKNYSDIQVADAPNGANANKKFENKLNLNDGMGCFACKDGNYLMIDSDDTAYFNTKMLLQIGNFTDSIGTSITNTARPNALNILRNIGRSSATVNSTVQDQTLLDRLNEKYDNAFKTLANIGETEYSGTMEISWCLDNIPAAQYYSYIKSKNLSELMFCGTYQCGAAGNGWVRKSRSGQGGWIFCFKVLASAVTALKA